MMRSMGDAGIGRVEKLEPETVVPGVTRFRRVQQSGWELVMHAVRLGDGSLLVHSPTWLGEGTFEAIERLGAPRLLLAPNHYHHLSLERFRQRYPAARAIASEEAIPRLAKKGHAGLAPLGSVARDLPAGSRFLVPKGLKNGETWLSLAGPSGRVWLVCDAFFHVNRPAQGPFGWALRMTRTVPGLRLGDTFRWLAVGDRDVYRNWTLRRLAEERPVVMGVSHGDVVAHPDLPDKLASLVHQRLG